MDSNEPRPGVRLTPDQLRELAAKCDELAQALLLATDSLPIRTLGASRIAESVLGSLQTMLEADACTIERRAERVRRGMVRGV